MQKREVSVLQLRIQGAGNCFWVFLGAVLFVSRQISCSRHGKPQGRSDLATDEREFGSEICAGGICVMQWSLKESFTLEFVGLGMGRE